MLSVIINTFPPKTKQLVLCLFSLSSQSNKKFEVIVVSDGKSDYCKDAVEKFKDKLEIRYLERENDKCVSRSRNLGDYNAKTDYLVFLDGDIVLNSEAINSYILHSKKENTVTFGKMLNKDKKSLLIKDDLRMLFSNQIIKEYIEDQSRNHLFELKPYFFSWSGNFGIERELFFKIGGFDESYLGWGHEDIDFGLKLFKKNISFKFSDEVEGIHLRQKEHKIDSFYDFKYERKNAEKIDNLLMYELDKYLNGSDDTIKKEIEFLKKRGLDKKILENLYQFKNYFSLNRNHYRIYEKFSERIMYLYSV